MSANHVTLYLSAEARAEAQQLAEALEAQGAGVGLIKRRGQHAGKFSPAELWHWLIQDARDRLDEASK